MTDISQPKVPVVEVPINDLETLIKLADLAVRANGLSLPAPNEPPVAAIAGSLHMEYVPRLNALKTDYNLALANWQKAKEDREKKSKESAK